MEYLETGLSAVRIHELLQEKGFRQVQIYQRKVYRDCHIYLEYNYYSVPFEYVGNEVEVEVNDSLVKVLYQGQQIALHQRLIKKGQFSTNESHYPSYKLIFSSNSKKRLADKMQNIGDNANKLFTLLVEKYPHSWFSQIDLTCLY